MSTKCIHHLSVSGTGSPCSWAGRLGRLECLKRREIGEPGWRREALEVIGPCCHFYSHRPCKLVAWKKVDQVSLLFKGSDHSIVTNYWEVIKNGLCMVRLPIRVDPHPPPPYSQLFFVFLGMCKEKFVTLFSVFLMGISFHNCLWFDLRWLRYLI